MSNERNPSSQNSPSWSQNSQSSEYDFSEPLSPLSQSPPSCISTPPLPPPPDDFTDLELIDHLHEWIHNDTLSDITLIRYIEDLPQIIFYFYATDRQREHGTIYYMKELTNYRPGGRQTQYVRKLDYDTVLKRNITWEACSEYSGIRVRRDGVGDSDDVDVDVDDDPAVVAGYKTTYQYRHPNDKCDRSFELTEYRLFDMRHWGKVVCKLKALQDVNTYTDTDEDDDDDGGGGGGGGGGVGGEEEQEDVDSPEAADEYEMEEDSSEAADEHEMEDSSEDMDEHEMEEEEEEDIHVEGLIEGLAVQFHRTRIVDVGFSGAIKTSEMGGILLALVLSVARMKFVGVDDPAPTQRGFQIDHPVRFHESLNGVFLHLTLYQEMYLSNNA